MSRQAWDHPRVCGENWCLPLRRSRTLGSPPRVRGKPVEQLFLEGRRRITPACAGKTQPRAGGSRAAGDHPRVCGENARYRLAHNLGVGSPPRVRGKPAALGFRRARRRITPACAGKTIRAAGDATAL